MLPAVWFSMSDCHVSVADVQAELAKSDIRIPIIFLTAHGDVSMTVRAMKAGAVDFLTKPFREQEVLDAVAASLERRSNRIEHLLLVERLGQKVDRASLHRPYRG